MPELAIAFDCNDDSDGHHDHVPVTQEGGEVKRQALAEAKWRSGGGVRTHGYSYPYNPGVESADKVIYNGGYYMSRGYS